MGAVDWKSLILSPREPLSEDLGAGCRVPSACEPGWCLQVAGTCQGGGERWAFLKPALTSDIRPGVGSFTHFHCDKQK